MNDLTERLEYPYYYWKFDCIKTEYTQTYSTVNFNYLILKPILV
jgi:hypothetical protein